MSDLIISAEQAKKITVNSPRYSMQADNSKLKTIMQNIKKYASNGHFSFKYQANITYNMAKILIDLGYVLAKEKDGKYEALLLDDFEYKHQSWVYICWDKRGIINENH